MSSTVTMPDGPPVLVGDDAQRAALALELGQEVVQRLGLGEDRHVADRRLDRGVRAGVHVEPDEAVVVDDPADLVGVVVLDHDQAGVAGGDAAAKRLLDRLVGVHRHDGRDRGHHLARLLLVEMEDAAQHPRLAEVEDPAGGRAPDDLLQVLRGVLLLDVTGVTPNSRRIAFETLLRTKVNGALATRNQLTGRTSTRAARLGPRDREHLRHLLADGDVEGRRDREGQRERDPAARP